MATHTYRTGDRVRVRPDLDEDEEYYNDLTVGWGMLDHAGAFVTIDTCHDEDEWYYIREDDGEWLWAVDMFDMSVPNKKYSVTDNEIESMKMSQFFDFISPTDEILDEAEVEVVTDEY